MTDERNKFETTTWNEMAMYLMTNGTYDTAVLNKCFPSAENWIKTLNIYCQVVTKNFHGIPAVKTAHMLGDLEKNKLLPVLTIGAKKIEGEFFQVHLGDYKGQKVAAKILKEKRGPEALIEIYNELIIQSYFYNSRPNLRIF